MLMRTSNPALNAKAFTSVEKARTAQEAMTISGTINKAGLLLVFVLIGAVWTWKMFFNSGNPQVVIPWMWVGIIGGLIAAIATIVKKQWSPITAPIYAVFEGLFIGAISAVLEAQFKGVVIQAVGLTFGTLLCLLAAYKSGLIKATENFKLGVVAATGGIAIVYIITLILGFFGVNVSFVYGNSLVSIGFSIFVVVIAALNLVLDFDFIENGSKAGVPKYMEWYAAFGLMVTLIWLYIEILRLLAKINSRR